MKRILSFLLLSLLCVACLKTPEQEYIINKGDDELEQKLNAAPALPQETDEASLEKTDGAQITPAESRDASGNAVQRQGFPDRWETDPIPVADRFAIRVSADVVARADGLYPVYCTRSAHFTKEQTLAFLNLLLGKPDGAQETVLTKEDWGRQLQQYLNRVEEYRQWEAAGRPDWGDRDEQGYTPEQEEQKTAWYMEQIRNAPDAADSVAVSDFAGQDLSKPRVYTLASGGQAYVQANSTRIVVGKHCRSDPEIWYLYDVDFSEPQAGNWHDVTLARRDADAALAQEIERLGLEDFTVRRAAQANLLETDASSFGSYVTGGWAYTLTRDFGGYPTSEINFTASTRLAYECDDAVANKPIRAEEIVLLFDEQGLQYFAYDNPKEIVGLKNANVKLLPFDAVQDRVVKALSVCYPYADYLKNHKLRDVTLEVPKLLLTTYTIRQKDSNDYYEMPCWIVFFERFVNGLEFTQAQGEYGGFQANYITYPCLILNAVDGSIIDPKSGY